MFMRPDVFQSTFNGNSLPQDFQVGWNSSKCVGPSLPRKKEMCVSPVREARWFKSLSKSSIRSRRKLVGFVRPGIRPPPNTMDDGGIDIFSLSRDRTRLQWCLQEGERARPAVEECRSHEAHKSEARMSLGLVEGLKEDDLGHGGSARKFCNVSIEKHTF